jgi:pimeloyl-ACP methyl ester carboxylesterase
MATFLLVHGTFAQGAEWTRAHSPLRQCIKDACDKRNEASTFIPIEWSGRNRIRDRLTAAETIFSNIEAVRNKLENEKIFLVGHSHGGSAIAYFLKRFNTDSNLIRAAIFLSTPFIASKQKQNIKSRVVIYSYTFYILIQILWFFLIKQVSEMYGFVAFGCFLLYSYRSFNFFNRLIAGRISEVDRIIKSQDSCALPENKYLVVKFSGDEAAAAMTFSQFVSYALNNAVDKIYNVVSIFINKVSNNKIVGKEFPELFCIAFLCLWLAFSPSIIGYKFTYEQISKLADADRIATIAEVNKDIREREDDLKERIRSFPGFIYCSDSQSHSCDDDPQWKDIGQRGEALLNAREYVVNIETDSRIWYKFYFLSVIKTLGLALYVFVVLVSAITILLYLSLRVFGSVRLTELLYGEHNIIHLDWKEIGEQSRELRHSEVYTSDSALQKLSDWINTQV